jgi:tetratricopeptide (TPR) repeat protein
LPAHRKQSEHRRIDLGIGGPFTVILKAVDCQSGVVVADVQEFAPRREQVLQATGRAATQLRKVLGESLASIQKYDILPENVTTGSLEALRAYSLGHRANISGDYKAAMLFFDEATRRDPNFAMAYARLAVVSRWAGSGPSPENARKAYDLRERVSERERFYIESTYENSVTENLEAARKIYETWMQLYPRDDVPATNLANVYGVLGEYEKVVHLKQESRKREPGNPATYIGLIGAYMSLNRFDEVRATIEEARARSIDHPGFHVALLLAFLERDTAGMEREVAT